MVDLHKLEHYLHGQIPLTRAMGVQVRAASPEAVEVFAPLAPNINHQGTVFGGSAAAVAILAAWCLVQVRLQAEGLAGRVIIHSNSMRCEQPIVTDFTGHATAPEDGAWRRLVQALNRGRMARINLQSELHCQGRVVGTLDGEFVVLPEAEK